VSYPNLPGKHEHPSFISSDQMREELHRGARRPLGPPPGGAILCYQKVLWSAVCSDPQAAEHGLFGLRVLQNGERSVGVAGGFGFGAPVTCVLLEGLIAYGVRRFVSVGTAGALQADLSIGDVVVCDRAIRDEGTSHHYLAPAKYAAASRDTTARLRAALERRGIPYRLGTSWTIDAPYRETTAEIRHYQQEGVVTVDMEASALFAVAAYRQVEMGALFTISDSLAGERWDPHFRSEEVARGLRTLYQVALEVLWA
jgi:uridine phosphorylase